MNPGNINGMHSFDSRHQVRDCRTGHFMDKGPKSRILLGRTANRGEGPDRIWAVINMSHPHDRKIMSQAVIAQVVTKRTFRTGLIRKNVTTETEVSLRRCQQAVRRCNNLQSMPSQQAGESQLRHPLRQGHYGGKAQARGTTDKNINGKLLPSFQGFLVVDTNPAMDLVM